jgi:hypothetical protein
MPYPYRSRTESFERKASLFLVGAWFLLFLASGVYLILGRQYPDLMQWLGIH